VIQVIKLEALNLEKSQSPIPKKILKDEIERKKSNHTNFFKKITIQKIRINIMITTIINM
jgi:hypothetical protein